MILQEDTSNHQRYLQPLTWDTFPTIEDTSDRLRKIFLRRDDDAPEEIKKEMCLTQAVLDYVKDCQQLFMYQPDEYYIKRYLHGCPEENQSDIPSKEDMVHVGLSESHANDFCTFLRDYKYINRQSICYWLDFYLECVKKTEEITVLKLSF